MLIKQIILMILLFSSLTAQNVEEVIDQIWEKIGGQENYQAAHQLSFTFVVKNKDQITTKREHLWDRNSGDYVLTYADPDNQSLNQVFFNINTRTGKAYRDKSAVSEEENKKLVEYAYGAFINDTYWLLVSAKLRDPGVHVNLDKKMSEEAGFTVLHLSFDNVGLTPGDQFWLFVDDTGQIVRWTYLLQSNRRGDFIWEPVKDCGSGLHFSTHKKSADGNKVIEFQNVNFLREVDQSKFQPAFN